MTDKRIDNDPVNHNLKILPEYFEAQLESVKNFELRKNDRDFRIGDTILLIEIDLTKQNIGYEPTGRTLLVGINYILNSNKNNPFEGLQEGYCIISTEILNRA